MAVEVRGEGLSKGGGYTSLLTWFLVQLGFNIRGGKASQLGIFISKVIPDSDAHRAGLQEGDQVLSVNDVDFQDIEHSKAVEILKTAREITMRIIRDRRKELFTSEQLPAGASLEWLACKSLH
nr:PREDICTED: PDZ domain-containing protein 11 [Struthio camelus australis]